MTLKTKHSPPSSSVDFESSIHNVDYLPYLQSLKTMQQNLEDAGLLEESEIIKLAIMSLFCKYDQHNTLLKQLN